MDGRIPACREHDAGITHLQPITLQIEIHLQPITLHIETHLQPITLQID
ncbi:MAG: hypothetical protein ACI8WB_000147 [Phenylobacterium sp.]|jgi:hypothetical protein